MRATFVIAPVVSLALVAGAPAASAHGGVRPPAPPGPAATAGRPPPPA